MLPMYSRLLVVDHRLEPANYHVPSTSVSYSRPCLCCHSASRIRASGAVRPERVEEGAVDAEASDVRFTVRVADGLM